MRLVREWLVAALRDHNSIVVLDAVDLNPLAIAKIAKAAPDVVLVDVGQTDISETGRLIRVACPTAKLVAFGLNETVDQVFACATAGFSGYVPRESGADELYRAVTDTVEGRMQCAPQIVAAIYSRLAGFLRGSVPQPSLPILTSRESEILALIEQGRSNKEIARHLGISSATVKNHIHNLLQKLHVNRRIQAAMRLHEFRAP